MPIGTRKGMVRRTRTGKGIGKLAFTGRRKSTKTSPLYRKLEAQKIGLQKKLRSMRASGKSNPSKGVRVLWNGGGGVAAGAWNATMPTMMGVSTPLIMGSAFIIYGMTKGKFAGEFAAVGAGMLSKWAGDVSQGFIETGSMDLLNPVYFPSDPPIDELDIVTEEQILQEVAGL